MSAVNIKTDIIVYDRLKEFLDSIVISTKDVLITSKPVYDGYLKQYVLDWKVILQENYGAGEPSVELVENIYRDIKDYEYNRVIAIGGGSVLDISKLFALKYVSPVRKLLFKELPIEKEKELILIPTTCGTGSEVTNISILGLEPEKVKYGLAVDELYADKSILIQELLESLPFSVFATSSIDALVHASESYLSPKANAFTRVFSKEAIRNILSGYKKIAGDGEEARIPLIKDFQLASTMAGLAFGTAGNGIVHGLSHWLGGTCHVPHGEAVYVFFISALKAYEKKQHGGILEELLTLYAEILNVQRTEVYEKLEELLSHIIGKKSLREYGIKEEELEKSVGIIWDTQQRLLANSYTVLDEKALLEVLRDVYAK